MRQALLSDKLFIVEACLKYYPRLEETSLDMVLTLAIQDHREELVKRILQLPIDWSIRCVKEQGSMLRVAILCRGIDILTQLINKGPKAGVNVNAKNTFGSTALMNKIVISLTVSMMAVYFWRWINKVLLRMTPNRNERILDVKIKLGQECEREARDLIYKWSLILQQVEVNSIMRQALLSDKPFIVEAYLKYYPRLEETSLDMVLTLAIQDHHEGLVKRILQLSIDWSIRCEKEQGSMLRAAILYRRIDIFTQLINKGASKYLLMYAGHELLERAMECENLDYLRLLVEAGVNTNARNTFGSTALMYAVDRGDMPVIRLLLEAGTDPSIINHFDQTPLERATRTKPEILELLLNYTHKTHNSSISEGYNVNSLSRNKRCPIVGAIVHQNNEALKILIKYKANLKVTSSKAENALHIAVRFGTIQAVEMILETGEGELNEVSSFGETVLTWAYKIDGASLYPIEKNVHFICNEFLPWNTPKIFIPLLAKGKMAAVWESLVHTWIPFIFSGYRRKLTIIMTKIISREGKRARTLIRILAPMIRPSEMREIIEGLVESSDLETIKFCLEIYPQKSVLCLTSAFTHVLNEGNEEMIKLLLDYKVDYTTLENCHIPAIH
ncbi:hypothetical protein TSAR_015778 [Trichomalopsis sarcophagae]|uniref:Uncharacterized protein n=1 Tax=Trichomalopsis sarcophagae TaxID=543379 RepID=A0A232EJF0_9HYME|nr:hypothetical protein TSAR_015778 [Trichomalopsis sarcophagae]